MSAAKADLREKPHHPDWPLACLVFVFVFVLGLLAVHDSTTWLHLRSGQEILTQRALPAVDAYSYTVAGHGWTSDSWLADVLFRVIHDQFGPRGLWVLKSLVAAAAFALLLPVNPASPLVSAAVLSFGAVASSTGFVELPAIFDLLLMAAMIRLLRPRRFKPAVIVQTAALQCLWANLHGATALLGLWIVLLKTFKVSLRTEKKERLWHWAILGASLLALLANPHGFALIPHAFLGMEAAATAWQPLSPAPSRSAPRVLIVAILLQQGFLTLTAAGPSSLACAGIQAVGDSACVP